MIFFWKYFLRWIGFIRFVERSQVLGMPDTQRERVSYLWRWGRKYRQLCRMSRPLFIKGRINHVAVKKDAR